MFRSYLLKFGCLLLPCFSLVALNYLMLRGAGEFLSLPSIAQRQNDDAQCLYGTGLHADTYFYKISRYNAVRPEVVVLGSSRVMQLKGTYFSSSFLNLGGAMNSINGGQHLTNTLLGSHIPRVLLIGMDFWWFESNISPVLYRSTEPMSNPRVQMSYLFEPFRFLYQQKISLAEYGRFLLQHSFHPCRLGISAIVKQSGFGQDGSYYYGVPLLAGTDSDADVEFSQTLRLVRRGEGKFSYADHIDPEHFRRFLLFIRTWEQAGVHVVPFFPPMAEKINKEISLRGDRYRYLRELRTKLEEAGIAFMDFEDATQIGSFDCEFIDGFHGGDVTYARMILAMARRDPRVGALVDQTRLNNAIVQNHGLAFLREPSIRTIEETDFLHLGCQKGKITKQVSPANP